MTKSTLTLDPESRPPVNMAQQYGLDDDSVVENAVTLAPTLFGALKAVHRLKKQLPIQTTDELMRLLFETDLAVSSRYQAAREDLEDMCIVFPIDDAAELTRRLYIAAGYSHDRKHRSRADQLRGA